MEAKEQQLRLGMEEFAVVERERAGDEVVAAAGVREGEVARARWLESGRRCCRAMQPRRYCRGCATAILLAEHPPDNA